MSESLELLRVTGRLSVELRDELGNIKQAFDCPNIVVNNGKTFIAASMIKTTTNSPTAMTHMAVGTSSTAAAVTDTALIAEVAGSRTTVTPSTTSNTTQYACTFGAGVGTGTLNEAGIFNASSAGTMLCRTVFGSSIVKAAGDSLTITWTITIN